MACPNSTDRDMNIVSANSMPLEVEIELGCRVMIRQDAESLEPGQIVAMREEVDAPVRVYVDGVDFAIGELVVSEKRLAVRITGLNQPGEQKAA